jgi:serine/threonine protein kinase
MMRRMAERETFIGKRLTGGYELQQVLGSGAYGIVFRAHSQRTNTDAAAKLFEPLDVNNSDDPKIEIEQIKQKIKEFSKEAERLDRLEHKNIIPFYSHGILSLDDHTYPFIVMQYANEGSFAHYLR